MGTSTCDYFLYNFQIMRMQLYQYYMNALQTRPLIHVQPYASKQCQSFL